LDEDECDSIILSNPELVPFEDFVRINIVRKAFYHKMNAREQSIREIYDILQIAIDDIKEI
jgi:hypothetical protein